MSEYLESLTIHRPDLVAFLQAVVEAVASGYTVLDESNEFAPQAYIGMFVCTLHKPHPTEEEIAKTALQGDITDLLKLSSDQLKELVATEENQEEKAKLLEALNKVISLEAAKAGAVTQRGRPRNPNRDPGISFIKK